MKFGYIKSELDGSETSLDALYIKNQCSQEMPPTLDYSAVIAPLKNVKDQGNTSMCVCYSLSYALETIEFMSNPNRKFELDRDKIYSIRSDKGAEGMQIKEALEYVKKSGYRVGSEVHKILDYGTLKSDYAIRRSLFLNGPCIFGLPAYDEGVNLEFWKGHRYCGGHAVCCVGYNKSGFIIENSWGSSWGLGGKTILPFSEVGKLFEAWGILK